VLILTDSILGVSTDLGVSLWLVGLIMQSMEAGDGGGWGGWRCVTFSFVVSGGEGSLVISTFRRFKLGLFLLGGREDRLSSESFVVDGYVAEGAGGDAFIFTERQMSADRSR